MTIYQRMADAFSAAGIPGFFQVWRRTPEYPEIPQKFCAYHIVTERCSLSGDDRPLVQAYDIAVHIYGTSDLTADIEALCDALRSRNFLIGLVRGLDDMRAGDYQYHRRIDLTYYDYGLQGQEEE